MHAGCMLTGNETGVETRVHGYERGLGMRSWQASMYPSEYNNSHLLIVLHQAVHLFIWDYRIHCHLITSEGYQVWYWTKPTAPSTSSL